jgi:hypothetical protein
LRNFKISSKLCRQTNCFRVIASESLILEGLIATTKIITELKMPKAEISFGHKPIANGMKTTASWSDLATNQQASDPDSPKDYY